MGRFMKTVLTLAVLILCACGRDRAEQAADGPPISTPDALPATATTAPPPATGTTAPPAPAQVNGPKLAPVDEAQKDPSLAAFRDQLLDAVRRHDIDAVVAAADPKIRTSFGAGGGTGVLRQMLERPGTWADLEQILSLGGSFMGGRESFWAPYVYSAWPESRDAFTSLAVIAENVPLKQSPSGATVATLAHDIVDRIGDPHDGWQEIKLADGRTGFVETKFIRSPVGYRAGFNKTGDRWRMTALVAGD
jgi:hypothetical protein